MRMPPTKASGTRSLSREAFPWVGGSRQTTQVPTEGIGRRFRRSNAARHALYVETRDRVSRPALRRKGGCRPRAARSGQRRRITAYLRDEWGLNAILADGDGDEKNLADHRHHAVDAASLRSPTPARWSCSVVPPSWPKSAGMPPLHARGKALGVIARRRSPVGRCHQHLLSRQPPGQRGIAEETNYSKPHKSHMEMASRKNTGMSASRCKICRPTRWRTS